MANRTLALHLPGGRRDDWRRIVDTATLQRSMLQKKKKMYLSKVDQKVSYRRQIARQHSWSIRFHHVFAHHPSVVDSLGLG